MKITLERVLLILLAICFLTVSTCQSKRYKDIVSDLSKERLEKQKLEKIVNEQGDTIYTQNVIITDNQKALRELTDSIFNLKKKHDKKVADVIAYYKGVTETVIKEVAVPYVDTAVMKQWEDSVRAECQEVIDFYEHNSIPVPRLAYDSTEHYKILATVQLDSLVINSLVIPDTLQLRFVEKKNGFLKKKSIEVQFFHSNPLIKTTQSNSVIYTPPKKKNVLGKALLIGVGIFIGTKL
jgi:hypothetical protein